MFGNKEGMGLVVELITTHDKIHQVSLTSWCQSPDSPRWHVTVDNLIQMGKCQNSSHDIMIVQQIDTFNFTKNGKN
jgi:hypothetical protein